MTPGIDSAMLLAAGLGTRLRPLTLTTPKPLLPLDGVTLIDHQLNYLAHSGIRRVAINLHHLSRMIRDHVGDGGRYGLEIFFSEEPIILDTGGGIRKAAAFFGGRPFLALNSDALIDADISEVIAHHLRSSAAATMVVKKLADGYAYTPVAVDESLHVTGFGRGRHFYTGLQVLSEEVLRLMPPSGQPSCLINDGYVKLLSAGGTISAYEHEGYFNDLGTFERYEQAKRDIALGTFRLWSEPPPPTKLCS
ncbi:MAG: nucleotidyltransferase family protein [bacterium]